MARYNTIPFAFGGVPPDSLSASQGKVIYVAPYTGAAGNQGKTPAGAISTLTAAQALATADQNDIVYLLAQSNTGSLTTDYQTSLTGLEWAKDGVHLIGQNAGQRFSHRSRVAWHSKMATAGATPLVSSLKPLMTFSADGCRIENIEFFAGIASAYANGILVSGSRNHFKNCHIAGIGHADLDVTGAFSLSVTGDENYFEGCVIGIDSIVRTGANNELLLTNCKRNIFKDCVFVAWSETAGRTSVQIVATTGASGWVLFENCKFIDFTTNLGTGNTNVFDMPTQAGSYSHPTYLTGCAAFGGGAAGIGAAWSDVDTEIFIAMPAANAAGGKSLASN